MIAKRNRTPAKKAAPKPAPKPQGPAPLDPRLVRARRERGALRASLAGLDHEPLVKAVTDLTAALAVNSTTSEVDSAVGALKAASAELAEKIQALKENRDG